MYLAIDANIELSEEDGVFDVFGYVRKLRQQRRGLVETVVSLKFKSANCFLSAEKTWKLACGRLKIYYENSKL